MEKRWSSSRNSRGNGATFSGLGMALTIVALIAGCATNPPANTPSGNPEVTLEGVKADCVRSAFLNVIANGGYSIRTVNDTQIVAGRTSKNPMASLLLGTGMSGAPEERVTFLFIPQPTSDALRVVASSAYVSNQGTAFEKVQPMQGSQADQEKFLAAKSVIESGCRK